MNVKKITKIYPKNKKSESFSEKSGFRKVITVASLAFTVIFVAAVVVAGFGVGLAHSVMKADAEIQRQRIAALELDPGEPVDENAFADFDFGLQDPKINRLRFLNTHNSYRKRLTGYVDFFAGMVLSREWYNGLVYEHDTLTAQLNDGVRSFELDIHSSGGKLGVYHISNIDYGSTAPDFGLALKELKLWSANNPGHAPITVLLECKDESLFLAPFADKFDESLLRRLDDAILSGLGRQSLITPSDIIGGYADMQAALAADNWPTLSAAQGKFMFLLHYNDDLTDKYIGLDGSFNGRVMFPSVYADGDGRIAEKYLPYASHVLYNIPSKRGIDGLVRAGYIVRTRADADLKDQPSVRDEALASMAQIVTTDYEKGRILPKSGYYLDFSGKTIALMEF
ncbi:MAG: phosphatidylinositol-specific phospholipase C1-like protein [Clostridiales bacterium]|jgi:hypothetical protein|nr:phosphatidylinositol-specific phospholipase C1-like protein [Clostridiales bacterium]